MKLYGLAALVAASSVAGHSIWQDLWINGVDQSSTCVRMPPGNSPLTDVTSTNIRCNVNGATGVAKKCGVKAGDTVTIEMHQQIGARSCTDEGIGGNHWGPVQAYLSQVSDSSTADGSSDWFKIYADTWAQNGGGATDYWGTKDMNYCCGKLSFNIPSNIPSGDYLLRAESIALHAAGGAGGAQFYVSCFQLTVTGGSGTLPSGVKFPGAYKSTDPGILINIYQSLPGYTAPGPTVVSGGATKVPNVLSFGGNCAATSTVIGGGGGGSNPTSPAKTTSSAAPVKTTTTTSATVRTTTPAGRTTTPAAQTTSGGSSGCSVAAYGQCGGSGYSGCTTCAAGYKCSATNTYYSQCVTA